MKKRITIIITIITIIIVSSMIIYSLRKSHLNPVIKHTKFDSALTSISKETMYQTIDKGDFMLTYYVLAGDKSFHIEMYSDGKAKYFYHDYDYTKDQYIIKKLLLDENKINELAKLAVFKNIFSMNDKMNTTEIIHDGAELFIELRVGDNYIKAGGYSPDNKNFNDIHDAINPFVFENRPIMQSTIDRPEEITIETFNRYSNKMDRNQIKGFLTFNTYEPSNTRILDFSFVLDFLNKKYDPEHAKVVFEVSEGIEIVSDTSYTFNNVSDQIKRSIEIQLEGTSLSEHGQIIMHVTLFDDNEHEYDYLEMILYFYVSEAGIQLSYSPISD